MGREGGRVGEKHRLVTSPIPRTRDQAGRVRAVTGDLTGDLWVRRLTTAGSAEPRQPGRAPPFCAPHWQEVEHRARNTAFAQGFLACSLWQCWGGVGVLDPMRPCSRCGLSGTDPHPPSDPRLRIPFVRIGCHGETRPGEALPLQGMVVLECVS